jgi:hypothetical protein
VDPWTNISVSEKYRPTVSNFAPKRWPLSIKLHGVRSQEINNTFTAVTASYLTD